jgi:outer membrane protein
VPSLVQVREAVRSRFISFAAGMATIIVAASLIAWASGQGTGATPPPARIATIDVQKVLTTSNVGKAASDRMKKLQDDRMAKAKEMSADLEKLENQLKTKKSTLLPAEIKLLQKQDTQKRAAMMQFAQTAEKELGEARDKELGEINRQTLPVVQAIAKEMSLAAVFNKFESGMIYSADSLDITDAVIARMNAPAPAAPAPAPPPK